METDADVKKSARRIIETAWTLTIKHRDLFCLHQLVSDAVRVSVAYLGDKAARAELAEADRDAVYPEPCDDELDEVAACSARLVAVQQAAAEDAERLMRYLERKRAKRRESLTSPPAAE
ncbi:hypothetical protein [Fimbriiglobus ruber]|uniref:Uncharacterized protein n=1 Tax=Fimbriiglobus ruber TaxID=1908690 RepID=A0A225D6T1_9BACT|nr:hypothetical protein [Fimbriiglobus ruber]OWK34238.1 hypothetical protein FRUB_10209 [Fimbriiglobus ruber]